MANEQSSITVEAPTVIVSNSEEGNSNGEEIETSSHSAEAHTDGDTLISGSSLDDDAQSSVPESVAIAAIEAERDVTLATIHGEIERERISGIADDNAVQNEINEELEKCRMQIAELTGRVEALTLLIPPLVSEVVEEAVTDQSEIVPETNLTEPSTAVPIVEPLTEDLERNEEESPAEEEILNPVRRFIAI